MKEDGDHVCIETSVGVAVFSRAAGTLVSLRLGDREILIPHENETPAGPVLQAFRAPTDNDRGFGKWLARDWREAGLDRLARTVTEFAVSGAEDGPVRIRTVARSEAATGALLHKADWSLYGDGTIDLVNRFQAEGNLPPLPRLGIVLRLHPDLENLAWCGHGPHENYPDRKESTAVGLWQGTVSDQYVPYARPQECGSKQDVRFLSLTDAAGRGIRITAPAEPFAMNALHFTATDLAAARHPHELTPRPEVVLSLDAQQCGLGNSSCGPGVLERYAVLADRSEITLAVRFSFEGASR